MFLPTSPRPPSGMMRRLTRRSVCGYLDGGGLEQAQAGEAVAHPFALVVRGRDERQTVTADLVPEQVQGGLDRDRVRRHAQQLDRGAELAVEAAGALGVTGLPEPDELLHLRPDDVRVHADAAN